MGLAQRLEVGAGESDVDRQLGSQRLDSFFALGQQFEQLQALGTGDRLADAGDLLVEQVFDNSLFHSFNPMIIGLIGKPHKAADCTPYSCHFRARMLHDASRIRRLVRQPARPLDRQERMARDLPPSRPAPPTPRCSMSVAVRTGSAAWPTPASRSPDWISTLRPWISRAHIRRSASIT